MSEQSKILETFYNEFKDHLSEEKMMQLGEMVLYMEQLSQKAATEAYKLGSDESYLKGYFDAKTFFENGQK